MPLLIILVASVAELFVSYTNAIQRLSEQTQTTTYLIAEWIGASFANVKLVLKDIVSEIDPTHLDSAPENIAKYDATE